ncbi:hypothetical protein [Couchioplanes azureus]|uniref:hypothetical protein n=1 Tax=Couchioplanes caeruleus TaxID=56438 RepID=UPI00167066C1|nr:hypothetical protein [Couchioplanes caeruleus]GGQ84850.1 hypothetical protein GCM10010166_63870 [Couchioplanes caeruleus subsp. azureus]
MSRALPLLLAGVVALSLGALGTAALVNSLAGSSEATAGSVNEEQVTRDVLQTGVYGTR